MNLNLADDREFFRILTEIILKNLSDEKFGVDELVQESGLSISMVRHRLKISSNKTISQFIHEVRLRKAFELLQQGTVTSSEVAYSVGFGSPAYFNSCFHDFFGYPPGEVKKRVTKEYLKEAEKIQVEDILMKSGSNKVLPEGENIPDKKPDAKGNKISIRLSGKPARLLDKKRLAWYLLTAAILVSVLLFVFPEIFKSNKKAKPGSPGDRVTVAVMPFRNMTNDTTWNIWQNGIQDLIITNLSNNAEDLIIRDKELVNSLIWRKGIKNYTSITPSLAGKLSDQLNAGVSICGNIYSTGSLIRLNAQLINSGTETVIQSFQKEGNKETIIHVIDSLAYQIRDFLILSTLKKDKIDVQYLTTTTSPVAFKYFLLGRNAWNAGDPVSTIKWCKLALEIDSDFTFAMQFLVNGYGMSGSTAEAKKWCLKAYGKRAKMGLGEKLSADYLFAQYFETPHEAIKIMKQRIDIEYQNPVHHTNLAYQFLKLFQYDLVIPEYEKALELYSEWHITPLKSVTFSNLGNAYHQTGQLKKEHKLYKQAEQIFPDNLNIVYRQAILAFSEGKKKMGEACLEKYRMISKKEDRSEAATLSGIGNIYQEAGLLDKAEEYKRQACLSEPENGNIYTSLAYFLIDKERNINEGLELVEKALVKYPEHYNLLHIKGWGLCKLGKYREALEILQKSWEIRIEKDNYNHEAWLHLEAARKAVTGNLQNI